jgi:hypothetical protein
LLGEKNQGSKGLHVRWRRIQGGLKQLKSRVGRRLRSLAYDDALARRRDETSARLK